MYEKILITIYNKTVWMDEKSTGPFRYVHKKGMQRKTGIRVMYA